MYVELYSERVKALREEQGMTKRDLAEAAGISKTTARNAERGLPVRSKTARKVAAALGSTRPSPSAARRIGRRYTNGAGVILAGSPGPLTDWRADELR